MAFGNLCGCNLEVFTELFSAVDVTSPFSDAVVS